MQRAKVDRGGEEGAKRRRVEGPLQNSQMLLLPAKTLGLNQHGKTKIPKEGLRWHALSITSLTTFCREHAALQSMSIPQLMPLASYILKASPVVSTSTMICAKEELTRCIKSLEQLLLALQSRDTADNRERVTKASASVSAHLTHLASLPVDGNVLRDSGIGKYLKNGIYKNKNLAEVQPKLKEETGALMERWTEQVKRDNNAATLKGLKGGNIMVIPQKVKEEAAAQYLSQPRFARHCALSAESASSFLEAPRGCPCRFG